MRIVVTEDTKNTVSGFKTHLEQEVSTRTTSIVLGRTLSGSTGEFGLSRPPNEWSGHCRDTERTCLDSSTTDTRANLKGPVT